MSMPRIVLMAVLISSNLVHAAPYDDSIYKTVNFIDTIDWSIQDGIVLINTNSDHFQSSYSTYPAPGFDTQYLNWTWDLEKRTDVLTSSFVVQLNSLSTELKTSAIAVPRYTAAGIQSYATYYAYFSSSPYGSKLKQVGAGKVSYCNNSDGCGMAGFNSVSKWQDSELEHVQLKSSTTHHAVAGYFSLSGYAYTGQVIPPIEHVLANGSVSVLGSYQTYTERHIQNRDMLRILYEKVRNAKKIKLEEPKPEIIIRDRSNCCGGVRGSLENDLNQIRFGSIASLDIADTPSSSVLSPTNTVSVQGSDLIAFPVDLSKSSLIATIFVSKQNASTAGNLNLYFDDTLLSTINFTSMDVDDIYSIPISFAGLTKTKGALKFDNSHLGKDYNYNISLDMLSFSSLEDYAAAMQYLSVSSVPEPASISMLIAGLLLVMRNKRAFNRF